MLRDELERAREELSRAMAALDRAVVQTPPTEPNPTSTTDGGDLEAVWADASPSMRAQFLLSVLPEQAAIRQALHEARGLHEMLGAPDRLVEWLIGYPTLFAQTAELLCRFRTTGEIAASSAGERLAAVLLEELWTALQRALEPRGWNWILPLPGQQLGEEHVAVGAVAAGGIPPGRIAVRVRLGLRRGGEIVLPAQVRTALSERAVDPSVLTATPDPPPVSRPTAGSPGGPAVPAWIGRLQRGGLSQDYLGPLTRLAQAQDEPGLIEALTGAAPLLGGSSGLSATLSDADRTELLEWLSRAWELELIVPSVGDVVDPAQHRSVGSRRTAHLHEADTVARLQAPGFRRQCRVLVPAVVVHYSLGEFE